MEFISYLCHNKNRKCYEKRNTLWVHLPGDKGVRAYSVVLRMWKQHMSYTPFRKRGYGKAVCWKVRLQTILSPYLDKGRNRNNLQRPKSWLQIMEKSLSKENSMANYNHEIEDWWRHLGTFDRQNATPLIFASLHEDATDYLRRHRWMVGIPHAKRKGRCLFWFLPLRVLITEFYYEVPCSCEWGIFCFYMTDATLKHVEACRGMHAEIIAAQLFHPEQWIHSPQGTRIIFWHYFSYYFS